MGVVVLSALVITRNEGAGIARCLEALSFCDEIVLVDAESTDRTVEIAARFTDRVYIEPWRGFAAQKSFALEQCRGSWVLWVDADEVVTPALGARIREVVDGGGSAPVPFRAYALARRVHYLGAWIAHSGWGEDRVVRLFSRSHGRFSDDRVHERLIVDGPVGRLPGVLEHHSYRDLSHHWEKIGALSALGAEQAHERGRGARPLDLVFRPPARWFKLYVVRRGFLDGWRGVVIAGMGAAYVFLKYAMLREMEERERR